MVTSAGAGVSRSVLYADQSRNFGRKVTFGWLLGDKREKGSEVQLVFIENQKTKTNIV
jgi:hypothetical protein